MHVFSNLSCAWKSVDVVVSFFEPLCPQEGKDKQDSAVKAQNYSSMPVRDFSQRGPGFILCWFQRSCLDIEGCKSWFVIAGRRWGLFPIPLHWPCSQAPKKEKEASEKNSSSEVCLVYHLDFRQGAGGL